MKKSISLCIALLATTVLFAQSTVKGYVYEDSNQNGKKERREKGIPRVAVSNGQEVVLTNSKGTAKENMNYLLKMTILFQSSNHRDIKLR